MKPPHDGKITIFDTFCGTGALGLGAALGLGEYAEIKYAIDLSEIAVQVGRKGNIYV